MSISYALGLPQTVSHNSTAEVEADPEGNSMTITTNFHKNDVKRTGQREGKGN